MSKGNEKPTDLVESIPSLGLMSAAAQALMAKEVRSVAVEMQAAIMFPRSMVAVEAELMEQCARYDVAEEAFYKFPKGGKEISDLSIRMAELIVLTMTNISYGYDEMERTKDRVEIRAWAWDMQRRVRSSRTFWVEFKMTANSQIKLITDPRDQGDHAANIAKRRVRAVILEIIPPDIKEKVRVACRKTLAAGKDKSLSLADRIVIVIQRFKAFGVTQSMVEKYFGRPAENLNEDDLVEMLGIGKSLKDGMTRVSDWFAVGKTQRGTKADAMSEAYAEETIEGDLSDDTPPVEEVTL